MCKSNRGKKSIGFPDQTAQMSYSHKNHQNKENVARRSSAKASFQVVSKTKNQTKHVAQLLRRFKRWLENENRRQELEPESEIVRLGLLGSFCWLQVIVSWFCF